MFDDRCQIIYLDSNGLPKIWTISVHPMQDTDKTIKAHFDTQLKKYCGGDSARYLGHFFGDIQKMVEVLHTSQRGW